MTDLIVMLGMAFGPMGDPFDPTDMLRWVGATSTSTTKAPLWILNPGW